MDILIPLLIAVLVGFAFFFSIKVRTGNQRGGITEEAPAPGSDSGSAGDTADGDDRGSFNTIIDSRGQH